MMAVREGTTVATEAMRSRLLPPLPKPSCLPVWNGDHWECWCGWTADPELSPHEQDEEAWRHIPANVAPRTHGVP